MPVPDHLGVIGVQPDVQAGNRRRPAMLLDVRVATDDDAGANGP